MVLRRAAARRRKSGSRGKRFGFAAPGRLLLRRRRGFRFGLLVRPQSVLFVIGYGFGDEHVNAIIRQALAIPSFTLVIVDPCPKSKFVTMLRKQQDRRIWIAKGSRLGTLAGFVDEVLPDLRDEEIQRKRRRWNVGCGPGHLFRRGSSERKSGATKARRWYRRECAGVRGRRTEGRPLVWATNECLFIASLRGVDGLHSRGLAWPYDGGTRERRFCVGMAGA